MSETVSLESIDAHCYLLRIEAITLRHVDDACEHLFLLPERVNPRYFIISQEDHDTLYQLVEAGTFRCHVPGDAVLVPRLVTYINTTTGTLMEVFVSRHIKQGVILFGCYPEEVRS